MTGRASGSYIPAFADASPTDTTDMTNRIPVTFAAALGGVLLCAVLAGGCAHRSADNAASAKPRTVQGYVDAVQAKERGDTQGAIHALEGATQANPDLTMARDMLGDLYRAGGEYQKATVQYEALVRLDPYTALNHYKLGVSYHFLQRLQETGHLGKVKIIVLSAHLHVDPHAVLQMGVSAILPKPFNLPELIDLIEHLS